jgi:hypothetical protein
MVWQTSSEQLSRGNAFACTAKKHISTTTGSRREAGDCVTQGDTCRALSEAADHPARRRSPPLTARAAVATVATSAANDRHVVDDVDD